MLKSYKLRATEFNRLLESFSCYTEYTENLHEYFCGYKNKQIIRYNENQLICTESHLNYLNLLAEDETKVYTDWLQVVITLDNEAVENKVKKEISGLSAWCRVHQSLQRYYKKDEIKEILSSYDTEYNYDLIQQHYLPSERGLKVYRNCTYYDINGAHNYILTSIFNKATDYFTELYNNRKVNPDNKKIVNYFVGMLNTKNKKTDTYNRYPGCYNYIVQSVTNMITPAVQKALGKSGLLIYENTDGFIVQNVEQAPVISDKLGDFKIEASGDIYTYVDKNYWCIQYRDKDGKKTLKGNVLNSVRELIDLEQGKVVHYEKVRNEFKQFVAKNITTEIINSIEEVK